MENILNLQGLVPLQANESVDGIVVSVGRRPGAQEWCPHCGARSLAPNGARAVTYADMPIRGKPVSIQWERQRFICRETLCGKTSADRHPALHDDFLMTHRLFDWIGKRSLEHTFAAVSRDVGLDERSVRRVFEQWSSERLGKLAIATPTILGMDEVHLFRAARGVLANISDRTLIDLLPNRSHETMGRRLTLMPDRDRVEVVAMDMWRPYETLARSLMPQATVVIDKWHVTKYADLGMETARKSHRGTLTAPMRRRLVRDRHLLLTRRKNLTPEKRLILETWTNHFPDLAAVYEAKEAFYGVYDHPTRASAEAAFDSWERGLTKEQRQPFVKLLSATRNWRAPIFNYFDTKVTNAYTEALNGLVKIVNRNGRGYSFDVLRARMLLNREAARQKGVAAAVMEEFVGFSYGHSRPTPRRMVNVSIGIDIATMARVASTDHWRELSTEIAG